MNRADDIPSRPRDVHPESVARREALGPFPLVRSVAAGVLMGLANLVPGVSGGTMILVTGLYDDFITAVADVTRLRFTGRGVLLLVVIGCAALAAIAAAAGVLSRTVTFHRSAMYALFIGLTLGGAPLLIRMIRRATAAAIVGLVAGLGVMIVVAATRPERPDAAARTDSATDAQVRIEPSYGLDLAAGALGMSAMVLPGVSGAYMLLVLGRYEAVLAAVAQAKDFVVAGGAPGGAPTFLHVLVPAAVGALVSLVALSNVLTWMLHRHPRPTLGFLLGILLGCVAGIWPFSAASQPRDYVLGTALAMIGFLATATLSRVRA